MGISQMQTATSFQLVPVDGLMPTLTGFDLYFDLFGLVFTSADMLSMDIGTSPRMTQLLGQFSSTDE